MDVSKMFEDYVKARLTLGGCCLKIIGALVILVGIPVLIWQMIEKVLKDLSITWPMYLMFALLAVSIIVGVTVYKKAKVNPGRKAAVVLAGSCAAFTTATVLVFLYYNVVLMGILYAMLSLTGWWITYRMFFPIKKKNEAQ